MKLDGKNAIYVFNSDYNPSYFTIGALNLDTSVIFLKKYEGFDSTELDYLADQSRFTSSI